MPWQATYTDTFGGEPNYCWVHRAEIEAETPLLALRRARAALGLSGVRGKVTADFGEEIHWRPYGCATVLMVSWQEERQ